MRSKFKEEHPQATVTEVSSGLGEQWKKMTDKEKKVCDGVYNQLLPRTVSTQKPSTFVNYEKR